MDKFVPFKEASDEEETLIQKTQQNSDDTHRIEEIDIPPSPKKINLDVITEKIRNQKASNSISNRSAWLSIIPPILALVVIVILMAYGFKKAYSNDSSTPQIWKPDIDSRNFTSFKLRNGIRVLAVQDSSSMTSSAAVQVNIGSYADPENILGLAHLVEHVLFLFSEKYSKLNDFQNLIANNGGVTNAYTTSSATNYYFEVGNDAFEQALDMFAQFFIDPIINQTALDQEIPSVNSEFEKDLTQEDWRIKFLLQTVSDPDSKFARFSIGNTETLSDIPDSLNVNMTETTIRFFQTYYVSSLMTLVVVSNRSLEETKEYCELTFDEIKSSKKVADNYMSLPFPFEQPYDSNFVEFLRLDNKITLTLAFNPKSSQLTPLDSGINYILFHLNSKSHGSLNSALKSKGLALDLNAGILEASPAFDVVTINVRLTDAGFESRLDVVKLVFAQLDLIRNITQNKTMFNDVSVLKEFSFRFTAQQELPSEEASRLAKNMQIYLAQFAVSGDDLFYKHNGDKLEHLLEQMRPQNCTILLGSSNFVINNTLEKARKKSLLVSEIPDSDTDFSIRELDLYSKRYNLNYNIKKTPREVLNTLEGINKTSFSDLSITINHDYIPKSLNTTSKCSGNDTICDPTYFLKDPNIIFDDENLTVYHLFDPSYKTPLLYCAVQMSNPFIYQSINTFLVASIFAQMVNQKTEELLYDMQLPGNVVTITLDSITIYAYDDIFDSIFDKIFTAFSNTTFTEEEFDRARESVGAAILEQVSQEVYQKIINRAKSLLTTYFYSPSSLADALLIIDFNIFSALAKDYQRAMHLDVLFMGNVLKERAVTTSQKIQTMMKFNGIQRKYVPHAETRNLSTRNLVFREFNNIATPEYGVLNIYQGGPLTPTDYAYLKMYEYLFSSEAYTYLRTIKNLGYVATCYIDMMTNVLSVNILVQGSESNPNPIDIEIERFVKSSLEEMGGLPEDKFNMTKKAFTGQMKLRDKDLKQKGDRMFRHIQNYDFDFDMRDEVLLVIDGITIKSFRDYFMGYFGKAAKLSVQMYKSDDAVNGYSTVRMDASLQNCGKEADVVMSTEIFEQIPLFGEQDYVFLP